ncbi:MAG: class I SAM-dependent methyltransferase [Longimicrobiales bacterium]
MGDYAAAAEFYDLLYASVKDYPAEAVLLAGIVRDAMPHATRLLDVACGSGEHARALSLLGFDVDGVDLEPAFVALAQARCPGGRFVVGDMTSLDLERRYDVVLCLFSAIGYAVTVPRLNQTVARLAAHVEPDGLVIVDPWFEPGQLTHRHVAMRTGETDQLAVSRISRTLIDGRMSRLEFSYLIGRPDGIEHLVESHALGLFTQDEMEAAFENAGLTVQRLPEVLRTRGLYVGQRGR